MRILTLKTYNCVGVLMITLAIALAGQSTQAETKLTGPKPKPIKPHTQKEIQASIDRGVEFLIQKQNPSGSWGSALRTKGLNIYASIPGSHQAFRAAVTALCISALIEAEAGTAKANPKTIQALKKGEKWFLENIDKVRRADQTAIYNVWTHGYGIQALVRMHKRLPNDKKRQQRIEKLIKQQFDMLKRYESVNGGWGYYDFNIGAKRPSSSSISFCNAAILVGLKEASDIGVNPPSGMVNRAIKATQKQRKPDFSYLYGDYLKNRPLAGINRPAGSLGRSQACNAALGMWGDRKITHDVHSVWLDRLWARNDWLGIGRKRPVPHEAWFQVAGYFYYFGHYYAARCIDMLPEKDRPHHQQHLAFIIMKHQDKDGCWWDFPFYDYHQPYGTAFAVMTLERCKESK